MRKLPKREGNRAVVVLCALLTTSACTQPVKKSAPPPPTPPPAAQQTSAPSVTPPPFNGPLRLHEVRVIESLGQHSVLFRLSRPPEGIDYFPLRNPNRLVIDIKGAIEPLQQVQHYKAADPLIAAVRVGSYQGRMRLVVDLKGGEPPAFSVDNYDTLVTAFIGEKRAKTNGTEQAQSNAQVLFLAEEMKEASRTQLASTTPQLTSTAATEKVPLPTEPPTVDASLDSPQKKLEPSVTVKEISQKEQPEESLTHSSLASSTASAPPSVTATATNAESANNIQEEILAPTPPPAQFEANLTETSIPTEEEPWEVKRITQGPTSATQKMRPTKQREAEEPLLLAREESAPSAAEFRADQALQYTGRKISLDFKNADIHDVLRIVAEVSGLNIVATDDVRARVTLRLVEVPWDQALDVVLQANGLEKTQTGNVITVSTTKRLEAERNARLAAQNAQQKITPLVTEYVKVNYVKATDVAALITREAHQRTSSAGAGASAAPRASGAAAGGTGGGRGQQVALMSPRGTIAADSTTNVLILRDLPDNITAIRELVRNIDVQTPQVVIESYLVTTSENLNRALGIQWGYSYKASPETGNPTGVNFPGRIGLGGSGLNTGSGNVPFIADFPAAGVAPGSGAALDLLLGSLDGTQSLAARLSALEQQGKVRVISRPRVVTINNKAADIRSRRVVRVPIISGTLNVGGAGSTQGGGDAFQEFDVGITLKVTPQISSDGFVLLDIDAETSDLAPASVRPTGSGSSFPLIPDTLTRTASSNVLIRAGNTFVLGGILQDAIDQSESGIPYLRDTPGLGWLFRGRSNNRLKSELLVFITPNLVAGVSNASLPTAQQLWENRQKNAPPQAAVQQ